MSFVCSIGKQLVIWSVAQNLSKNNNFDKLFDEIDPSHIFRSVKSTWLLSRKLLSPENQSLRSRSALTRLQHSSSVDRRWCNHWLWLCKYTSPTLQFHFQAPCYWENTLVVHIHSLYGAIPLIIIYTKKKMPFE